MLAGCGEAAQAHDSEVMMPEAREAIHDRRTPSQSAMRDAESRWL
jgi:hypothetical protein